MPYADSSTDEPMIRSLRWMVQKPHAGSFTVIDCGVGAGRIAKVLRDAQLVPDMTITGIEVFAPYIEPGPTRDRIGAGAFLMLYDHIILADFCAWLEYDAKTQSADVVIFGDSLEHVEPEQALKTLAHARRVARIGVIVNAPIIHYPQGEILGNVHEIHRLHWSRAEWEKLGGVYVGGNDIVGCFVFSAVV